MSVNIISTGEFDLELFSYQTDIPEGLVHEILMDLDGLARSWDVKIHDPNDHEPNGSVTIRHRSFDEHTEIAVSSRHDETGITYDVYRPMTTDILTEAEGVPLDKALTIAVRVANDERRRQSRLLPPYNIPNPLTRIRP